MRVIALDSLTGGVRDSQIALSMAVALLCHEVGHRIQDFYNTWGSDDAAQMFTTFCSLGGACTTEEVASAIGAALLNRLGRKVPVIPGLDHLLEAIKQARQI